MAISTNLSDPFDLARYISAQEPIYDTALREIREGRKRSHWMWFVFPQIAGLGHSDMARRYAIQNVGEAEAFLRHPTLGRRLIECCEAAAAVPDKSAREVFGSPDDLKLCSCVTLFSRVPGADPLFQRVLHRYFAGQPDEVTLQLMERSAGVGT